MIKIYKNGDDKFQHFDTDKGEFVGKQYDSWEAANAAKHSDKHTNSLPWLGQ